jgi:restriction system protein
MSKNTESNLWGIHGGKTGDADTLFLKKSCVAVGWTNVGWTKMGDLAALKPDRDAFKARVVEVYPEKKPGVISNNQGYRLTSCKQLPTRSSCSFSAAYVPVAKRRVLGVQKSVLCT